MNSKSQRLTVVFVGLVVTGILLGLVYYSTYSDESINASQHERSLEQFTNTISIGTIDDDAYTIITKMQPTADYLSEKLSNAQQYKGKVIATQSVEDMITLLKEQKLDLYFESPVTAMVVADQSGAKPFLSRWKDGVSSYHTVFFVKSDSQIKTIDDFVGKTIAFENPESSSGFLIPKSYLIQNGFHLNISNSPDQINYVFAGEDVNVLAWVNDGKAEIGTVSNVDFDSFSETYGDVFTIIATTSELPRHLVLHRSGLDSDTVDKIKTILLDMDDDPEGFKILQDFKNTKKFEEIQNKKVTFDEIKKIISALK